jgi:hypothetical protein
MCSPSTWRGVKSSKGGKLYSERNLFKYTMDELYPLSVLSAHPNPALSGRDGGAAAMVVFLLVVDGDAW